VIGELLLFLHPERPFFIPSEAGEPYCNEFDSIPSEAREPYCNGFVSIPSEASETPSGAREPYSLKKVIINRRKLLHSGLPEPQNKSTENFFSVLTSGPEGHVFLIWAAGINACSTLITPAACC